MGGPGSGAHLRKYVTRPAGSWFNHRWVPDIVTIAAEERELPQTVPHEEVAGHPAGCECTPCAAYRREQPELLAQLKRRRLRSR